jgi:ABC-type dipeptide/oligopeptide/nickel transport system permease subunit
VVLLSDRRSRLIPFFLSNVFVVLPFFLLVMLGVLLGERGLYPGLLLGSIHVAIVTVGIVLWLRLLRR